MFQYIPVAKDFAAGLYGKALGHGQQPLYPFLTALMSFGVSDFEVSGKLVSTLCGLLLVFPVYFLGKRVFDRRVAFFSVLLLVIHPYIRRFSGDVLKESTYLFFYATAIWFAWKVLDEEKKYPYLFVPIVSLLPYLVRPDGLEVLLAVFFYVLFVKRFPLPESRWKVVLLLLLASGAILFPYLLQIKWTTGVWTLSKAKALAGILGLGGDQFGPSFGSRLYYSLKTLNLELQAVYNPIYLFLLAIGLWGSIRSRWKEGELFLFILAVLHYGVSFLVLLNLTEWQREGNVRMAYFSGRHLMPLLVVSIYWVGKGFLILHDGLVAKIGRSVSSADGETVRKTTATLLIFSALMAGVILPKTLKPQRYDRISEKWAGTWIKNQPGEKKTIFTTLPRVAYYGEGDLVLIQSAKEAKDRIKDSPIRSDAVYVVVQEHETVSAEGGEGSWLQDLMEVKRFGGKRMETVVVYRSVRH